MQKEVKLWNRDFVFIIIINFLVFLNHLSILSTFPFYIEYLGGSEAVAGMAAAMFSIVAVLCRPFIGWMLDNGKRKAILVVGLCGMMLMPIGYLVLGTLFLAFVCRMVHGASLAFSNTSTATIATDIIPRPRFAEGMGMFGMAAVLSGFGFGGLEPALQSMAVAIAPPENRGSANSTFLCAYDIGIGVGGGIAGVLISSFDYGKMFVIMAVFNILSILVYVLIGRNHPSSFTYRKKLAAK